MMKYQEPEMDVIALESVSVITESTLYVPGDGSNTGGNGGGSWNDF